MKPSDKDAKAFDLRELIEAHAVAKAAWEVADATSDAGPEWEAYQKAEWVVVIHPCRTLEDARVKARFLLEEDGAYDTIQNCEGETEDCLRSFLRSLLGEDQAMKVIGEAQS